MAESDSRRRHAKTQERLPLPDEVALVLQGGGALGAYQAGVIQGLEEKGIEVDWVAGISIGAVNAAIFAGNVVVRQGSLTLRTARLTLAYASQDGIDINRIDASGGVTVTSPSETAKGDFAVYDLDDGLITMVGNVRLERGGSYLSGARLTIDLDTGRAVMDGGLRGVNQDGGGRVTGRFTVPRRNSN